VSEGDLNHSAYCRSRRRSLAEPLTLSCALAGVDLLAPMSEPHSRTARYPFTSSAPRDVMTDKDRETIRELVKLEHLLIGLPGDPRQWLTVAGQGRAPGPRPGLPR
jgi:hypothetical protein